MYWWIYGNDEDEVLDGTPIHDIIYGEGGNDRLIGEEGDDTLIGGPGSDNLDGGPGDDWLGGSDGDDVLSGGDGNDIIVDQSGTFDGGAGDDRFSVGESWERGTISGGSGTDALVIYHWMLPASLAFSGVENLDFGTAATGGTIAQISAFKLFTNTQNRILGRFEVLLTGPGGPISFKSRTGTYGVIAGLGTTSGGNLTGTVHADQLGGSEFNDKLNGDDGDDLLTGWRGDDTIVGGGGTDTAAFLGNRWDYSVTLTSDGRVKVRDLRSGSPDGTDFLSGVEFLRFGYSDTYPVPRPVTPKFFTEEADAINFNALTAEQVAGVAKGFNVHAALGGQDTVILPGSVAAAAAASFTIAGWFDGGGGDDTITGGALEDRIRGGEGDDRIAPGGGSNTVHGDAGADIVDLRAAGFPAGAAGTTQVIDGGGSPAGKVDVVRLPGAATDYAIGVVFGATWQDTETVLIASGASSFTVRLRDVERAEFADRVANVVTPFDGSVAVEMALLAKEVYGPNPTLGHTAEKLGWELGWKPAETREVANRAEARGWHGVEAIELGLAAGNPGDPAALKWSMENGHYMARTGETFLGDRPEANALVLSGLVAGSDGEEKRTLAVVFRGTDQLADFTHYDSFAQHYALFAPLVAGIKSYVGDAANGIEQVVVSGHSLGAGAAQYFLSEALPSGVEVRGWTYGSPGSEAHPPGQPIAFNLVHTQDPVTLAPLGTTTFVSALGLALATAVSPLGLPFLGVADTGRILAALATLQPKARDGVDVRLSSDLAGFYDLAEHAQTGYVSDLRKLLTFARDPGSPFFAAREPFAQAVLAGSTYLGPPLQIAVGSPVDHEAHYNDSGPGQPRYFQTVRATGDDAYVLGSDAADDRFILLPQGVLGSLESIGANGTRRFDGGKGNDDAIVVPTQVGGSRLERTGLADGGVHLVVDLDGKVVIGDAYRVEKVIGIDTVVKLDGSAVSKQTPPSSASAASTMAAATPLFQLQAGFDYAEVGGGAWQVRGTAAGDVVYLGDGAISVEGLGGDDILVARPSSLGDKSLDGGLGSDIMVGDRGNDRFVVDSAGDVVMDLGGGTDTVESAVSFVLPDGVERLVLLGAAALDGTGNAGANGLVGNDGANLLDGRAGADAMEGGAGDDTYVVDSARDRVVERDGEGTDLVVAAVSFNLAELAVEHLALSGTATRGLGNALANTIVGNAADNRLYGGAGNDALDGGSGNDRLSGELGEDVLVGGAGDDLYIVDTSSDTVREDTVLGLDDGGVDKVQATATFTLGAFVEDLTLTGALAINGTGNGLANKLTGNSAANTLEGGGGGDILTGAGGADTLDGGEDGDTYYVDINDILQDSGTTGIDTAIISGGAIVLGAGSGIENLTAKAGTTTNVSLSGDEAANRLTGNDGINTLSGMGGDDVILAGVGDDRLQGGLGADRLQGGLGRDQKTGGDGGDTFIFKAGDSPSTVSPLACDIITDFVSGTDRIDLHTIAGSLAAAAYGETISASNGFGLVSAAATAAMADGTKQVVFVAGPTDGWLFWNTDADPTSHEQAVRLGGLADVGLFQRSDLT